MLIYRVLTALILIPLVVASIFYLPLFPFVVLIAGLFLIAGWEWTHLMGMKRRLLRVLFLFLLAITFALFSMLPAELLLALAVLTWITITYFIFNFSLFSRLWAKYFLPRAIAGLWVLGLAWYGMSFIRAQHMGSIYVLLLLIWVWSADTGAYFIGRWLGKAKLAPQISPGKSIAGFWGGVVITLLVALICGFFLPNKPELYVLALITALVSVVGDLFESMVKRQSSIKDSGKLLPGHGGMLDRLDSLISAAPIFAALLGLLLYFRGLSH